MPDDDDMLTIREIAGEAERAWRHRPSLETVRLWLRTGRLRGWRASRRVGWRAKRRDVAAFLATESAEHTEREGGNEGGN